MTHTQFLLAYFLSALMACGHPEVDIEKKRIPKKTLTEQNAMSPSVKQGGLPESEASPMTSAAGVSVGAAPKKKRDLIAPSAETLAVEIRRKEQEDVVPGFVKSIFFVEGNTCHFKREVKQEEDRRVGCSGGSSEWTFCIQNPADSFLLENDSLKSLHFKYQITGGMYVEQGRVPPKGFVRGKRLSGNAWKIEMQLSVTMTDLQINKEVERQMEVADTFIRSK